MRFSILAARLALGVLVATFVVGLAGLNPAQAQRGSTPAVNAFVANPGQVLQQYPNGGPALSTLIQDLVVADASTLPVIMNLLANANPEQRGAIGSGLGQAAKIVVVNNQALATDIQTRVATIDDPVIKLAFTRALGDVQLGAIGGGGGALGGAGGGVGGQTNPLFNANGAGGVPQDIRSHPVGTSFFTFSSSVSPGSGPVSQ